MNGSEAPRTPLMAFIVEFLRGKPDATFQEVQSGSGASRIFKIAPINYGNARRMLGMAAKTRARGAAKAQAPPRRRSRGADNAAAAATAPAARGRRGRKRKLDFSNLSNLVRSYRTSLPKGTAYWPRSTRLPASFATSDRQE